MDKYITVFCKQNPKFKLKCVACKTQLDHKSKDVFKTNKFKFICPKCNAITIYDTTKFKSDLEKALKKQKIIVK